MRKALFLICLLVLLVSCATNTLDDNQYVFQAMGSEKCAVITVRSDKTGGKRVSFELDGQNNIRGVLELEALPSSVVKTVLRSNGFERRSKGGLTWYEDQSGLKVSIQKKAFAVFTNGDIASAVDELINRRNLLIDDETALKMVMMPYSVYMSDLSAVKDLLPMLSGFELENFNSMLLMSQDLGKWTVEAELKTAELASAFTKLLKAKAVSGIIRSGQKPDIVELESLFDLNGCQVRARDISGFDFDLPELGMINEYL